MIDIIIYRIGFRISRMSVELNGKQITVNHKEIANMLRSNPDEDIRFIDRDDLLFDTTESFLVNILDKLENKKKNSGINLNNVIRQGGFISYIKKLEASNDEKKNSINGDKERPN